MAIWFRSHHSKVRSKVHSKVHSKVRFQSPILESTFKVYCLYRSNNFQIVGWLYVHTIYQLIIKLWCQINGILSLSICTSIFQPFSIGTMFRWFLESKILPFDTLILVYSILVFIWPLFSHFLFYALHTHTHKHCGHDQLSIDAWLSASLRFA